MRYQEIRQRLTDYFAEGIRRKKSIIDEAGRLSGNEIDEYIRGAAHGSILSDLGYPNHPHLVPFFEWAHINIVEGTRAYQIASTEYEVAYSRFCQYLLDYHKSLDTYVFEPSLEPLAVSKSTRALNRKSLGEVVDLFIAEHLAADRWHPKTEHDMRKHFKLLKDVLGEDTSIADVSPQQAIDVKNIVLKLPKNRNKVRATKGRPVREVIALQDLEKVSVTTINKSLQAYKGLFAWAKRNLYVSDNLFEGLAVTAKRQGNDDKRSAFTPKQLSKMLYELKSNECGLVNLDYQKWAPLIAIYTGARLNEIAQLKNADIKIEGGHHYFDLNDDDENARLKNASSKRHVPIHSELLELGLLDYVSTKIASNEDRLFPELTYTPKNGYGRNLSRWFNDKFLPKLELKSKQLVFHSIRHSVVTELMQKDVPEPIVKAIVGHSRAGVTQKNYFKQGYTLEQLSIALEKLKW